MTIVNIGSSPRNKMVFYIDIRYYNTIILYLLINLIFMKYIILFRYALIFPVRHQYYLFIQS